MDTQYAFRVPAETLEALKTIAAKQDLSVAQLMRRLCTECVYQWRVGERNAAS